MKAQRAVSGGCAPALSTQRIFDWEGMSHLQREIHEPKKDIDILKKSINDYPCAYYFCSHIFPPVLPFSSTSYSNTPTRWSRKTSFPVVVDDDRDVLDEEDVVRQNSEPKSLLLSPE